MCTFSTTTTTTVSTHNWKWTCVDLNECVVVFGCWCRLVQLVAWLRTFSLLKNCNFRRKYSSDISEIILWNYLTALVMSKNRHQPKYTFIISGIKNSRSHLPGSFHTALNSYVWRFDTVLWVCLTLSLNVCLTAGSKRKLFVYFWVLLKLWKNRWRNERKTQRYFNSTYQARAPCSVRIVCWLPNVVAFFSMWFISVFIYV